MVRDGAAKDKPSKVLLHNALITDNFIVYQAGRSLKAFDMRHFPQGLQVQPLLRSLSFDRQVGPEAEASHTVDEVFSLSLPLSLSQANTHWANDG